MHTAIPAIAGVPIEFILFAAVLAGVAVLHRHSLRVALIGLAVITVYKIVFSSFHGTPERQASPRISPASGSS
jgi:type IV secretory pathway VirB3-like protein